MVAIGYSLSAALAWGLADFLAGLKSRRLSVLTVLLWVEGAGLLAALVLIAITTTGLPGGRALLASAIAGVAGLTALGCFYKALSIGTMSVVAPISATGVTLPVIVGIAGGNTLHPVVGAGLAVTFAGVLLASREEVSGEQLRGPNRPAILLAVVAALGFGTYFVFADVGADGSILWLLAVGRIIVLPAVALLAYRRGDALVPEPAQRPQLAAIGLVDLSATGLYGLANTHGQLSIVAVVGSLYPVATILLARGVLGERLTGVQGAGVLAALAGVGMVSAG